MASFYSSIKDNFVLNSAVSDEWLALTYSEYLESCASEVQNLVESTKAASADEGLQDLIDEYSDYLADVRLKIKNSRTTLAINSGEPLFNIDIKSDEYCSYIGNWLVENYDIYESLLEFFEDPFLSVDDVAFKLTSMSDDEIILNKSSFKSMVNVLATSVLTDMDISDTAEFCFNAGSANIKACVKEMINHIVLDLNSNEELDIALHGDGHNDLQNAKLTTNEIFTGLYDCISSSLSWACGFAASTESNIADKLTKFNSRINNFINSTSTTYNSIKSTVSQTLMSAGNSVKAFINAAEGLFGIYKFDGTTGLTMGDTNLSQYTGANPLSAVNLKAVTGATTVVGAVIYTVGQGIWNGIKNIVKKVWVKIKPYAKAITSNPVDIKVIDKESDSYLLQDFQFQDDISIVVTAPNTTPNGFISWFNTHNVDKYICFKTLFSEIIIKPSSIFDGGSNWIIRGDYYYKPRSVNYDSAVAAGLIEIAGAMSTSDYSPASFVDCLQAYINNDDMYSHDDADERDIGLGFAIAHGLTWITFLLAAKQMYNADSIHSIPSWEAVNNGVDGAITLPIECDKTWYYNGQSPIEGWVHYRCQLWALNTVSNADFMKVGTGFFQYDGNTYLSVIQNSKDEDWTTPTSNGIIGSASSWECHKTNGSNSWMFYYDFKNDYVKEEGVDSSAVKDDCRWWSHNVPGFSTGNIMAAVLVVYLNQQIDKYANPSDYIFLPYSKDVIIFSEPKYKVMTDQQNMNIANILAAAITVVAAVIVSVIAVTIVKRKITTKRLAKLTSKREQMTSDVWEGKELSPKEYRKYRRWSRKIDKLSDSDFIGTASSANSLFDFNKVQALQQSTQYGDIKGDIYSPKSSSNENSVLNGVLNINKIISGTPFTDVQM